jgi:PAP2 superfamily
MHIRRAIRFSIRPLALVLASLLQAGCGEETSFQSPTADRLDGDDVVNHSTGDRGTSVLRWNRKAIAIFRSRLIPGTPPPNATRINTYLSLAQFRATRVAAKRPPRGARDPDATLAGAAAGASVAVLKEFYPEDADDIGGEFRAQRDQYHRRRLKAFDLGAALGQEQAAVVLAKAATDNVGKTPAPTPPTGPGRWVSSGAPIVTGGFRARPFVLRSFTEINSEPPPAFGSDAFLSDLAQVRKFSDERTPEQVAIVEKWVPFSGVVWNGIATDLIEKHRRSELQAARILAYANVAGFDAGIGCFETKFTYWLIRPTQADPDITLATPLPNHPSYPSAHSCETGAWQTVLTDAFPSEHGLLSATAREASLSRIIGGLHYPFDGEAGLKLGRKAGRLALRRGLNEQVE